MLANLSSISKNSSSRNTHCSIVYKSENFKRALLDDIITQHTMDSYTTIKNNVGSFLNVNIKWIYHSYFLKLR